MLTIVFVTFLWAPGMPILFFVGLFGMVIVYVGDRLALAYWHKRPPVYNDDMNYMTISLMMHAPLLYIIVGSWLYSNQQAFQDVVVVNEHDTVFAPSDHYVLSLVTQLNPSLVFLFYPFFVIGAWS